MKKEQEEANTGRFDEGEELENEEEEDMENINIDNLLQKKTTNTLFQKELKHLFMNNECELSFYFFSQTNPIRIVSCKIARSRKFDHFITSILIFSTFHQIVESFLEDKEAIFASGVIDIIISFIYLLEFIIKTIALGFIEESGTYMSYSWNRLDFFVIILTIIDVWNRIAFLVNDSLVEALGFFNYFKLLRNLRTLRLLAKNDNMKKIIGSLVDSLGNIFKILGIVFVVIVMFSIMGITMFYKIYDTCFVPGLWHGTMDLLPITNFTKILSTFNLSLEKNPIESKNFVRIKI